MFLTAAARMAHLSSNGLIELEADDLVREGFLVARTIYSLSVEYVSRTPKRVFRGILHRHDGFARLEMIKNSSSWALNTIQCSHTCECDNPVP